MTVGFINKIETFATLDGDGIRVAVFTQGCPLSCVFCHNPDTQKIFPSDYVGRADKLIILPSDGEICYKATVYKPETLANKLLRFKPYLNGGGVTFTGGEPLLQADFLSETAEYLQKEHISIAIDTSCSVFNDSTKRLLSYCDTVIADLKFPSAEEYKRHTGGCLNTVLSFFEYVKELGKKLIVRTVIIPGINDSEAAVKSYIDLLYSRYLLQSIDNYELLSFHTMGFSKYDDYGMENKIKDVRALSENVRDRLQSYADSLIKTLIN